MRIMAPQPSLVPRQQLHPLLFRLLSLTTFLKMGTTSFSTAFDISKHHFQHRSTFRPSFSTCRFDIPTSLSAFRFDIPSSFSSPFDISSSFSAPSSTCYHRLPIPLNIPSSALQLHSTCHCKSFSSAQHAVVIFISAQHACIVIFHLPLNMPLSSSLFIQAQVVFSQTDPLRPPQSSASSKRKKSTKPR